MRNSLAFFSLISLAAVAAASPASDRTMARSEAELARATAGRIEGKPVDCITQSRLGPSRIIDGLAIVYEYGSTIYVNRPAPGCIGLRRDSAIVTHTFSDRLCRGDLAHFVDLSSHFDYGACGLGDFVPYSRPKR